MPIFVQWKWQDKTKTFLVIFHFFDDFSKPNLRCKQNKIKKEDATLWVLRDRGVLTDSDEKADDTPWTSVMTWAPSHVEVGLLGELLRYANIIDGLDILEKQLLRAKLEIMIKSKDDMIFVPDFLRKVKASLPAKTSLLGFQRDRLIFGTELCPEYIEYLKEVTGEYL